MQSYIGKKAYMKIGKLILIIVAVAILVMLTLILNIGGIFNKTHISPIRLNTKANVPTDNVISPGKIEMPLWRIGTDDLSVTTNGFSPKVITIVKGSKVIWTNYSGSDVTVNSDNYPTNKLYQPLNLGMFPNKFSVSLVFDRDGTFYYHDQLHPQWTGTVIVYH
jgi:plastocyanin